jgi:hypothetical protein
MIGNSLHAAETRINVRMFPLKPKAGLSGPPTDKSWAHKGSVALSERA